MVAAAQASASRAQALADRAAALLFYVALAAGAVTLVGWWLLGDPEDALVRTATVLVIACPHALGLAIPLVIAISTSLGARNGLLVKDRIALERARELDIVIFDKTGTLTKGEPVVADVVVAPRASMRRRCSGSRHRSRPTRSTRSRGPSCAPRPSGGSSPAPATAFEALAGRGARAVVDGRTVHVGGPRLLDELDRDARRSLASVTEGWAAQGRTVLHVDRRRPPRRRPRARGRDPAGVGRGGRAAACAWACASR